MSRNGKGRKRFNPKKDATARRPRPPVVTKPHPATPGTTVEVGTPEEVRVNYSRIATVGPMTTFGLTEPIEVVSGVQIVARVSVIVEEGAEIPDALRSRIAGQFLAGGVGRLFALPILDVQTMTPAEEAPDRPVDAPIEAPASGTPSPAPEGAEGADPAVTARPPHNCPNGPTCPCRTIPEGDAPPADCTIATNPDPVDPATIEAENRQAEAETFAEEIGGACPVAPESPAKAPYKHKSGAAKRKAAAERAAAEAAAKGA